MLSYYIAQYTNVNLNWGMACAWGPCCWPRRWCSMRRVPPHWSKSELSLG